MKLGERGGVAGVRSGVRPPRIALVAGLNKDSQSLMLLTLVKGLKELGYIFTVFALENGEDHSLWEHVGCQVSVLSTDGSDSIDWSNYEGVILNSLEAQRAMSSFMHEPFDSIPVIWIVQEDTLGTHLSSYKDMGWQHLIAVWRSAFSRADVVVFPDFSLPMLYTTLDTGNFYVIPQSPVDIWAAKSYNRSHSRDQLRKESGFNEDDLIVLVIGSYFFYDDLPQDYAKAINALGGKFATSTNGGRIRCVILSGNSTEAQDSDFQELASHMRFPDGSVRHYGMGGDVNGVLLMSDIVVYGSFQEEQSFPPLLVRAMSFEIPIIAPDLAIIKKYVVENVHGLLFKPSQPDTLAEAFALLIADMELSEQAHAIASRGKSLATNMFAADCITDYAKLLGHVLHFPSEVVLPESTSQIQQKTWLWGLLEKESEESATNVQHENLTHNYANQRLNTVETLEEQYTDTAHIDNATFGEMDYVTPDIPTQQDWNDLSVMEISEDIINREMLEHEERMERSSGSWEEIYRNTRKAEKQKYEASERDEGELERTGQPLCIYEIYNGEGAWPFLHHGSLYRGISLSKRARRSRSDDVDAVSRLPILNDTKYKDLLGEAGAMFSVANKVDTIHKIPWIGFQSWRAAGRKVSLSNKAEQVLEETVQAQTKGDLFIYWALMDLDQKEKELNENVDFWSMCDISNAGHCRTAFEDTIRKLYGLPAHMAALPPMPADGGKWSALHSWVMPTPSFLEFVMFSRMFVDTLHSLDLSPDSPPLCVLGSSQLEKKQCYCRVLEVLVNVWAYHSGRKMVYLNPSTGEFHEQHPIEQRKGLMWARYFDSTLLKSMDEDLAEEADDNTLPTSKWLWPLTGEVHWQGILDRERENRYRQKMDKKKKTKEKLLERQKYGYKQKPISANKDG